MEPTSVVAIITAVIPFATAGIKKLLKTDQWGNRKHGWNSLIPIVLGIVSSGVFAYSQGSDVVTSLAVGLGSGGAASSMRNIEKDLVNLIGGLRAIFAKKSGE